MANYRGVIEWQHAGDAHWYASAAFILGFPPETVAAVREIVATPQGFPFPGLSSVALAEADTAIHSTATLMSHDQVRAAHEAHERTHGTPSKDLAQVLRLMDKYAEQGMAARFVFWESMAAS